MNDYFNCCKSFHKGKWSTKVNYEINSKDDLSKLYSPGVANSCLEIVKNPESVFCNTGIGNSVAVITNGSAVLGFGNIGVLASKPVMESKAMLFKRCAGINAVDIQIDTQDVDEFVNTVSLISKGFGAINLEDIAAPLCFEIEEKLQSILDIPVFHDDQHGTAIAILAGLINAFKSTNRSKDSSKIVIFGAGSAGIATANLLLEWGVKKDNIVIFDSKGLINYSRNDLNSYKWQFISRYNNDQEAVKGADVVIGLSKGNSISKDLVCNMKKSPIFFVLSNPVPDISIDDIKSLYPDAIIAAGGSNAFNQINNLLVFPYIFRAALDCRATQITSNMKISAANAIADMVNIECADSNSGLKIVPDILDRNLFFKVSLLVMEAAKNDGVCRQNISDYSSYLEKILLYDV